MKASVLIVSRNRIDSLKKTLFILEKLVDFSNNEILVFLDGCTDSSSELKLIFPKVRWFESTKSLGASSARRKLYPNAKGKYLIGLDDDAHPLNVDFIERVLMVFMGNPNVGIIAFKEIRGVYNSDEEALAQNPNNLEEYFSSEFIGCGFAIKNEVYKMTRGFPIWVDIYGEEACVSIEVLSKGFEILFTNRICVNHRVNTELRKKTGANYFRFGKQLKNTAYYYLVYYPFPFFKIARLIWHNFKKYALMDFKYFIIFFRAIFEILINIPNILRYRSPVDKSVLFKMKGLSKLKF